MSTTGKLGSLAVGLAWLLSAQVAAVENEPCPGRPVVEGANADGAPPDASPPLLELALEDGKYILGAPLRWSGKQWLAFSGVAAGVVAFGFALDVPARSKTRSHQTAALDDLTRIVEPFGQEYSWAVIGAYGIAGFVFRDPEARDIAVDSALATILASGIITPVLKQVIGRARPNQNQGSTSFHPFSGDQSFPVWPHDPGLCGCVRHQRALGQGVGQHRRVHVGRARGVLTDLSRRALELGRRGGSGHRDRGGPRPGHFQSQAAREARRTSTWPSRRSSTRTAAAWRSRFSSERATA